MCASLVKGLGWPATTLGDTQASADYQQEYTATLGSSSTTYTGEVREILIQFPTVTEASAQLHTYAAAAAHCTNWTYPSAGAWGTSSQQVHTSDLTTSADESIVLESSESAKGQTGAFNGITDTSNDTLAVLRKGPLLAYVAVSPGHQGMSSWPTAALVLPAVADDLNR